MPRPAASPDSVDILSSLRRLVSEAGTPAATGPDAAQGGTPDAAQHMDGTGERLLLTPALRVDGCEAGQQPNDDGGGAGGDREAGTLAEEDAANASESDREPDCAAAEAGDAGICGATEPGTSGEPTADPGIGDAAAPQSRRLHLDAVSDASSAGHAEHDEDDEQDEATRTSSGNQEEKAEGMAQAQEKPDYEQAATDAREPEDILLAEDAEERILDEDTLREIVVQTVREELMGELGERITRNVKKLVRREIHRAIASREFED